MPVYSHVFIAPYNSAITAVRGHKSSRQWCHAISMAGANEY